MSAEADGGDNCSNATDSQSEDNFSDATETGASFDLEKKGGDCDSGEVDGETTTDSSGDESLSDSAVKAAWDNHFESVVKYYAGDDGSSDSEDEKNYYKRTCKQVEQLAKARALEKQKKAIKGEDQEEEAEDITVTVNLTTTVELNGDDNATENSFEDSDACTVVSDGKDAALENKKDTPPRRPSPPTAVKVDSYPAPGPGPEGAQANGGADAPVDTHPIYTANLQHVWPQSKENDGGKERQTKFAKNVPKDASETWDFSMQGLIEDFKSNVLWVDGPFYQKFIGDCLHEMANTPCLSKCKNENGEVKKIPMCRKCHVPFCSNQCFKKAKQKQSGEIDSDEPSQAEKPRQSETVKNCLIQNSAQNARENNRPSYKDVCNKSNALPDKPSTSVENNKLGNPYQNRDRDGNFGAGGGYNRPQPLRNQNQPFQNNYPYSQPGAGPSYPVGAPMISPPHKFFPTQVLTNNLAMRRSPASPPLPPDGSQKVFRNPGGGSSPHLSETGSNSGEDSKAFFSNNWKKKGQSPGNFPKPFQNKGEQLPSANLPTGYPNGPSLSHSSFSRNRNDNQFHPQQLEDDGNWRNKKKQQPFFNNNMPGENFSKPFKDNRGGGGSSTDFNFPFQGPQSGRGRASGRGGKFQEDVHFRNLDPSFDPNQRWIDTTESNVVPAEHPESTDSSHHISSIHGQQPPPSSSCSFHTARMTSPSKTSSSSYNIKVDVGKNHLHLNRDVPYGITLPVKYVRGSSFQDFSVMTMRSHEEFGSFHRKLQTCPKKKMEICEFDSYCLVEYPSSDAENAPKQWYRGKITKVVSLIGIYFLDLGIEAVVSPEDVYELPQDHVKRWAQAIRLRSLNVKVDENDPEAVEQFDTLVRNAIVKIRITHQDQTVKFRYACYLDVLYMEKWFDAGVLLKKLLVGDRVSDEEIRQEEDKKSIIPLNRMKPPSSHILHEKQAEVIVRFVKSLNEFYVTTVSLLEAYDLIRKLNNVQLPPSQKTKLFAGDLSRLFFLLWDYKEKWQRVKVLEVGMEPESVWVQKIDFGEIVLVPIKALRPIPDDLKFPGCIYKCSLPVKPNPKQKSMMMQVFEQANDTLINNIFGANIRIQVFTIEDNNTHIVDLFKIGSDESCTASLIKAGLVEATHGFVYNGSTKADVALK